MAFVLLCAAIPAVRFFFAAEDAPGLAARRTPRAARRTPRLAVWQIVLEERCLGQTTCMFVVNDDLFGGDPCVGKQKRYAGYQPSIPR